MKKVALLLLVILAICFSGNAFAVSAIKEIKPGFIYVGPVGDAGWTYAHDLGRQEMEKLSYVQPSTFIETVPEGAESARVINGLVRKGHNLIARICQCGSHNLWTDASLLAKCDAYFFQDD